MFRILCAASLLFAVPSSGMEMTVSSQGIPTGVVRRMTRKSTADAEVDVADLPSDCTQFYKDYCSTTWSSMPSLDDLSSTLTTCCLNGGHSSGTCGGIATETFGGVATLHASTCTELLDLGRAHEDWVVGHRAYRALSAVEVGSKK